jgi:hypothetical protein
MNDQANEPLKPLPHPHFMISQMVDYALAAFGPSMTEAQFVELVKERPESWGWVIGCLGQKPALKFFAQLYDMRKAYYETPTN